MFNRSAFSLSLLFLLVISLICISTAQDRPREVKMSEDEARERKEVAEMQKRILLDKFDIILPQIMREQEVDMWMHIVREGDLDPLGHNFGSNEGIFIFSSHNPFQFLAHGFRRFIGHWHWFSKFVILNVFHQRLFSKYKIDNTKL